MSWIEECYSRLLIDSHITAEPAGNLARFSPADYAEAVARSGVGASMVYACDHNGLCYYPTRAGTMHPNLHGRDRFGETVARLRQNGLHVLAYTSVIYHNDAHARFPSGRIQKADGTSNAGRYRFVCPNAEEVRRFFCAQLREIASYDLDGIFIDMTFWPVLCFCSHCRQKFGRPFPERVDWSDPEWIRFQRFREQSMAEFARELTAAAKDTRPGLTVVHQFSPVLHGWFLGQTPAIADASDYVSGDFYGGKRQQRLATKIFQAFSKSAPAEFMTSLTGSLLDPTCRKAQEELTLSALTSLANANAFLFIDSIHPDGTLPGSCTTTLAAATSALAPFVKAAEATRPAIVADTGLYFSLESCVDRAQDGVPVANYAKADSNNMGTRKNPVMDELAGAARVLAENVIPFRILTCRDTDFQGLKALVLNNLEFLAPEECARIRGFVQNGGTLIATGFSSLRQMDGATTGNFQLADVFGVDYTGHDSAPMTYLTADGGFVSAAGRAPLVTPAPGTSVISALHVPAFPVDDPVHYVSIHANPPGRMLDNPGMTLHPFGKGRCIYFAPSILKSTSSHHRAFMAKVFRGYLPPPPATIENLPVSAEVTWLAPTAPGHRHELIMAIVDFPDELPALPMRNLLVRLNLQRLPWTPATILRVSTGAPVPFHRGHGFLEFELDFVRQGDFLVLSQERKHKEE